jgi:hypothetical protein
MFSETQTTNKIELHLSNQTKPSRVSEKHKTDDDKLITRAYNHCEEYFVHKILACIIIGLFIAGHAAIEII